MTCALTIFICFCQGQCGIYHYHGFIYIFVFVCLHYWWGVYQPQKANVDLAVGKSQFFYIAVISVYVDPYLISDNLIWDVTEKGSCDQLKKSHRMGAQTGGAYDNKDDSALADHALLR